MKTIILIITLMYNAFCMGQTIKYKNYEDSVGKYLIEYEYNSHLAVIPATIPPGQPHYDASIQVFQLIDCKCFKAIYDTIKIGNKIQGQYVQNGCFEDVPKNWVIIARTYSLNQKKFNNN